MLETGLSINTSTRYVACGGAAVESGFSGFFHEPRGRGLVSRDKSGAQGVVGLRSVAGAAIADIASGGRWPAMKRIFARSRCQGKPLLATLRTGWSPSLKVHVATAWNERRVMVPASPRCISPSADRRAKQ